MKYVIIYFIILSIGIVTGTYRFQKLSRSNRVFLLLLLITLISESIATYLRSIKFSPIFISYHIFYPIEYGLVAYAFYQEINKKIIAFSIAAMGVISLNLSLFIQPISFYNSYFNSIELLLITILCISYLQKLLKIQSEESLKNFPLFWISCGWLLFCVANLFFFGTLNTFFSKKNELQMTFAYIRIFTNYILYILFIVAFLVEQNTLQKNGRK